MTLLQVLPWLTQRQISAAAHRLSGQSETLVVGVCSIPVDLRAYWCSTCPTLFHDPRRSQIDPSGMNIVSHNATSWTLTSWKSSLVRPQRFNNGPYLFRRMGDGVGLPCSHFGYLTVPISRRHGMHA